MVDKDLLSIQEARALVRAARKAQPEFAQLSQERVDEVVKAVAEAAAAQAEVLANLAVEDTGFGRPKLGRPRPLGDVARQNHHIGPLLRRENYQSFNDQWLF